MGEKNYRIQLLLLLTYHKSLSKDVFIFRGEAYSSVVDPGSACRKSQVQPLASPGRPREDLCPKAWKATDIQSRQF